MRETQLKSSIQPVKLARKEGEVRFNWKVKDFERFASSLYSDKGNIQVLLSGYFDDRRRCLIKADIKADVQLECQTTFEAINHKIDKHVVYCALVDENQFKEVEDEFEPVLMEEGYLNVTQVIEDELILSVPIVANKSQDNINQPMSYGELDEKAIAEEKAKNNPFAVLKDLKKT